MVRYIEQYKNTEAKWVLELISSDAILNECAFQFVSSSFGVNIDSKLNAISSRTHVGGSAVTATTLLQIADRYVSTGNVELSIMKSNNQLPDIDLVF